MEILNYAVPNGPVNFSSLSPKFSRKIGNKKNLYRFYVPISKFHYTRLSPCYLAPTLQVSARFGETSRRRNCLRRKLIGDQSLRLNRVSSDPGTKPRNPNIDFDHDVKKNDDLNELTSSEGLKEKILEDSNLLNELESWVAQYKEEAEYWGIGSTPIFTVYQDLIGKVEKVQVDEDEIFRRRRDPENLAVVNSKVLYAKKLAEEMEHGKNVIPRNTSVAKFVSSKEESHFIGSIHNAIFRLDLVPKLPVIGRAVVCGFIVFWVLKVAVSYGNNKEVEYTEMEKEMMRRKMKARKEKEILEKGAVEVLWEDLEKRSVSFETPKLDEQDLISSISKVKGLKNKLEASNSSEGERAESVDFDGRIQEIKTMARRAREIEAGGGPDSVHDEKDKQVVNGEMDEDDEDTSMSSTNILRGEDFTSGESNDEDESLRISTETDQENAKFPGSVVPTENGVIQDSVSSNHEITQGLTEREPTISPLVPADKVVQSSDVPNGKPGKQKNGTAYRSRVIRSVKEAKEFLSRKRSGEELSQKPSQTTAQDSERFSEQQVHSSKEPGEVIRERLNDDNKNFHPASFDGRLGSTLGSNSFGKFLLEGADSLPPEKDGQGFSKPLHASEGVEPLPLKEGHCVNSLEGYERSVHEAAQSSLDYEHTETEQPARSKNWVEKNFHEFEPIVEKIRVGFRDNYMVAREKGSQQSGANAEITQLCSNEDGNKLDWMKDDKLRDIVFRVRDNELAGQDPFYSMDADEQVMFFQGLEKQVERENEKLSHLHEWLHSNIENLDYGADGISLYDPPEKIIPRWKGPPLEKNPDFLNNYHEQRRALFSEKAASAFPAKKEEQNSLQKSDESAATGNVATSSSDNTSNRSKIIVEGSDGSVRPGKKSGKEYWQHTKKWSRGFLELYNAETDPEVKAVMKDVGKDLARWITEEEIQEAAELMDKLPERNKKFMEKKLDKLKREMELYGPQAIVSKYREYGEEKEEDYLWWLDLPHVLCLELYTVDDGEQRVGFYALEMAADLELEPKPHHVIAFEDVADCKNICYIIQAHLDMLGNGNVFIVPRPPKDAFREAKANGFGVTVIRKGEVKLNIDQTLEEVEEQICEIGSKIYHDKITRERSVDISSLMKGVFGLKSKPTTRKRSKRMLKKLNKTQS